MKIKEIKKNKKKISFLIVVRRRTREYDRSIHRKGNNVCVRW